MLRNCLGMFAILACLAGCTSFRTMALYRFDNDSVVPECNNEKLKGLPVKLKVPSHVRVTIYEQQVLLANSPGDQAALDANVSALKDTVKTLRSDIRGLTDTLNAAQQEETESRGELNLAKSRYNTAVRNQTNDPAEFESAKVLLDSAQKRYDAAEAAKNIASLAAAIIPARQEALAQTQEFLQDAIKSAEAGYSLVSFKPAQLIVETQLDYTDKVFLVDFKRPAAGVLDLTEASMDDEQYFSKVQAEVEERTIQDVNAAITTLKGPLTAIKPTKATPTSADSTGTDQSMEVNFQMSVIATQRFDISEPDWEARMTSFVDTRLDTSDGSVADAAVEVPNAVTAAE